MKTFKVAIIVDPCGSSVGTMEEEIERHKERAIELLAPAKVKFCTPSGAYPGQIPDSTDIVMYDFGGMGLGNSMLDNNSQHLIRWAQDHQSAIVMVVSSFTYHHSIKMEMKEMGLTLPNIVCDDFHNDEGDNHPIPEWWRESYNLPYVDPYPVPKTAVKK